MAKIQTVNKCRKEQRCGKCGKTIEVGSPYLYAEPAFRAKIVRCTTCGLKPYETSSSEFIQTIGALQDKWQEEYTGDTAAEDIASVLEDLRDQAQDSLDNMPEQLQYSESGEILQERIDSLEDAISELEGIDIDDIKQEVIGRIEATVNFDDFKAFYVDTIDPEDYVVDEDGNIQISLDNLPDTEDYDQILDLPFIDDDVKNEMDEDFNEELASQIDSALESISY